MFCNDVIRNDLEHLKHTPCRNAFLISRHEGEEPVAEEFDPIGEHGRIEEVFGEYSNDLYGKLIDAFSCSRIS